MDHSVSDVGDPEAFSNNWPPDGHSSNFVTFQRFANQNACEMAIQELFFGRHICFLKFPGFNEPGNGN